MQTPFQAAIAANVSAAIRKARKAGTTSAGLDCLIQLTPTPSPLLKGAPAGTNAAYVYREMITEIIRTTPAFRAFASL